MSPSDPQTEHLAELRRRWQEDPGSRLFLQLAEEYRRAGRHAEAVEVLEAGLGHHPRQVSALVALGRARLELGLPDRAVEALEKAIELDATNLVANKLLIEAYLEEGDRTLARQRLDLYSLLSDGDPEVDELRRRAQAEPEGAGAAAAEDTATEAEVPGVGMAEGDSAAGGEAADAGGVAGGAGGEAWEAASEWIAEPEPAAGAGPDEGGGGRNAEPPGEASATGWQSGWRADELDADLAAGPGAAREDEGAAEAWAVDGGAPAAAAAPPAAAGSAAGDGRGEPFGDLAAAGARRRYLSAFAEAGIFPLELPPEAAAPPAPLEPEATDVEAPEPFAAPAAEASTFEPAAPHEAHEPHPLGLEPPPPLPEPGEPIELAEPAALAAGETGEPASSPGEPGPSGPAPFAEPPADRPTVTLGELYLEQGHPRQAEEMFTRVLDREPDSAAAAAGLERARAERRRRAAGPPRRPTARELLAEADPDHPPRVGLLHAYLARIRRRHQASAGERRSDVP